MLRRLQRRLLTTTPISEVSRPRSLLSRLLLHTPPPPEEIDLKALKSHHPHILKLTPELLEKTAVCIYNNSSNSLRSYSYAKLLSDSLATRAHSILNLKNDCKTASSTTTTACDLHGEKKPKRIALLAPPSYEFLVAKWATWLGGDCLVPLCVSHPVAEMAYTLSDSQSDILLYTSQFKSTVELLEKHLALQEHNHPIVFKELPSFSTTTNSGTSPILHNLNSLIHTSTSSSLSSFSIHSAAFTIHSNINAINPTSSLSVIDPENIALIIYTSGTTGKPKGVQITFNNLAAQISSLQQAWRWTESDRILSVLPLHHVHGLVNVVSCGLVSGATVEFMETSPIGTSSPFSAGNIWKRWIAGQEDPAVSSLSLFMAVPTIYSKLVTEYETKMTSHQQLLARTACSQFRLMVSGSAALPTSLFTKWAGISGHELLERYGMTEIGMALGNPIEGPRIPGHVGIPFPGVSVKIVNEQGVDITASTVDVSSSTNGEGSALIGELLVRGNQVSPGYFNRPAATQEAWTEPDQDPSGLKWFKTGDIATRIAYSGGGYSYKILGRASVDIIKSSGFKVSALDVEREILNHPRVAEVAVLGVPDDVYGERIGALIVLKEGDKAVVALAQDDTNHPHHPLFPPFTLSELQEWLSPRLAKYKSPSLLLIIDSLPKNALGKVNKKELKKLFMQKK